MVSSQKKHTEGDLFLAEIASQAGMITGQLGKLEWGFSTCDRELRRHGWDYHYGYCDHIVYSSHYGPSLVTRDGWKLRTFVRRNRILDFGTFGASLDDLRESQGG